MHGKRQHRQTFMAQPDVLDDLQAAAVLECKIGDNQAGCQGGDRVQSFPLGGALFLAWGKALLKKMNVQHRTSNPPEASKHLSAFGRSNVEWEKGRSGKWMRILGSGNGLRN